MRFTGSIPNTGWKRYPIDLLSQSNRYIPIHDHVKGDTFVSGCSTPGDVHLIPQRTNEWKEARRSILKDGIEYPIICSASMVGSILGFFQPKSASILGIPNWMCQSDIDVSDSTQVNLTWGINHESNALKTLLDCSYLNDRYPGFSIEESGIWPLDISSGDEQPCMISASLDGILVHNNIPKCIIETKCPSPFRWDRGTSMFSYRKRVPHDRIYPSYIAQIQMQLLIGENLFNRSMSTIFASWTPTTGTSIFEMEHNTEYTSLMILLLKQMRDEFLSTGIDTPENFWHNEDHPMYEQYQRFLYLTREISNHIYPSIIVSSYTHNNGDLFLDT